MKQWWTVIAILLLVMPFAAGQTEILNADMATIELTISNSVNFAAVGPGARVNEAEVKLQWYPIKHYNQFVESIETEPLGREIDEGYLFRWEEPGPGTFNIRVQSLLSTSNDILPVTKKVNFPLEGVTPELLPYTQPTGLIDTSDEIRALAAELSMGKDDLYEVVFALADWTTTNIEYNLSTLTAEATYPSTWVLEKRYGVCDEMTSLFISLNRALGIPARFISGLAFTNIPNRDPWGGHGWAEIYFPGHGWIPFDVTYGEYGYVDAGHLKLKESIDSEGTSLSASGIGSGFEIQTQPLDFDVKVLGERDRAFDIIEAKLTPYATEVGFGSYNLLTLELRNLRNHYVSTRVELSQTTQIKHASPDSVNVLLKPRGKTQLYFLVKVDDNLKSNFQYTFPIGAHTKLSSPVNTEFTANEFGPRLSDELFVQYFTKEKKRAADIRVTCEYPEYSKVGEITISCEFTNKEREKFTNLNVCIGENCKKFSFTSGESNIFETTLTREETGIFTIPIVISNGKIHKTHFETLNVLDETTMEISRLEIEPTITFDEPGRLEFLVERTSLSSPKSVRAYIDHSKFTHEWETKPIQTSQEYILRFRGQNLNAGENNLQLTIEYDDVFGETHTIERDVPIELVELTPGQKLTLWLDNIERWLENLIG